MSKTRNVYVVLSKSPTMLSQIIRTIKGDNYTHAALSLDQNLSYMFSFGRRRAWNPFVGCFKRESMSEGLNAKIRALPGLVREIAVTRHQYAAICAMTESFLLNAHAYGYNYFGLAGNLFGAAQDHDKRFFCSEFVYHVLHESGVCDLGVPRTMVRPQTLLGLPGRTIYNGDLKMYGLRSIAAADQPHLFQFPQYFSGA